MRRSRHHTQRSDDRRRIRDAISISEHSASVESSGPRSLGGRSAVWDQQQSDCDPRGTSFTLRDVGESRQQRCRDVRQHSDQERSQSAAGTLQVADMGPGYRVGRGIGEYEWAIKAIFPQGHRPLGDMQAKLYAVARKLNERPGIH